MSYFLQNVFQDARYALRQLRKSPGFTLTAVLTLALGIGANTAIFTLVHGILMRVLPVADPALLYRIGDNGECCVEGGFPGDADSTGDFSIFSYDLYQYIKSSTPEFEQLAAAQSASATWTTRHGNDAAKPLRGEFVSGNYFTTFGLNAYEGHLFSDNDDTPTASPAIVISYRAWQGDYAGDASIIGSTISVQSHPFTVIGIAPPGFFGDRMTDSPPDFWMPLNSEPYVSGEIMSILHHPETHWLYPIGRVRPGASIPALQSKVTAALRQWLYTRPNLTANGGNTLIPKIHVVIVPAGGGVQNMQQDTGKGLKMLMILSTVVLLIACANIANLILARATSRRSDLAVRMALGASRRRVTRQILTESVLLSCLGGLAGLAVAYGGTRLILALAYPDSHNIPIDASPSWIILSFAFLVSLVTGILFGAGPAWLSSHAQPAEALRGVNRSTSDRSSLPQKALVVFQAALSLVLIAGAILMSRSLANLEHQNFGIATDSRYVLHLDIGGAGYTVDRLPGLYRQIDDRFSALPGVANIGMATYSPLEGDNWGECVILQGRPAPRPGEHCGSTWDRVSTHFLDSIGVPIVRGRGFTDQDTATSPPVVIVNEVFVKRFLPNKDPIGQHFGIDDPKFNGSWEIVGVFRDFKMNNPRDPVRSVYLRPLSQKFAFNKSDMDSAETSSMFIDSIIVDFNRPQQNIDALLRQTLAQIDPNLTIMDLRSLNAQVAGNFNQSRLIAQLTSLFGMLALILASVGLYGVMSYFVARRTSEIGIRMALGATRQSVVSMVMRSALLQIAAGLALGIPAALLAGHLMASQLYGVVGYDPLSLAAAAGVLVLCAAFAGFLPARRAATVEPMKALRTE